MSTALPAGWAEVALSDVCRTVSQRGPNPGEVKFKYIDLGAIDNKGKRVVDPSTVSTNSAPSRAKQVVAAGDVLFSTVRVYLENIALIPNELGGAIASTAFTVLRPSSAIEPSYLYRFVTSKPFIQAVNALQRGNSPPSVQDGDVRSQRVPLPPLAEQQRIVSRIEELFSEIDEGERALERVGRLVERYRQSVLKAAVTGELTRGWREERNLSEWASAPINEVGTVVTGNTPPTNKPENYGNGLPFLKPTDLDQGYVVTAFRQSLTTRGQQYCRRLKENAVLVTCIGATIGKLGLARMPCATNQQINAVEVNASRVRAKFLYWYLVSPKGQRAIIGGASATTLPILNKSRFQSIEVPLPTLDEQDLVIAMVERHMDQAARAMATVAIEAQRLHALRQSILKAAFSGQLVPQDPNDEPAAALLARIASQAAESPSTPKRRGRPASRPASTA